MGTARASFRLVVGRGARSALPDRIETARYELEADERPGGGKWTVDEPISKVSTTTSAVYRTKETPSLCNGLARHEYRGHDSAGLGIDDDQPGLINISRRSLAAQACRRIRHRYFNGLHIAGLHCPHALDHSRTTLVIPSALVLATDSLSSTTLLLPTPLPSCSSDNDISNHGTSVKIVIHQLRLSRHDANMPETNASL